MTETDWHNWGQGAYQQGWSVIQACVEQGEQSGREIANDAWRDRRKVRCMDGWMNDERQKDRKGECVTVKDGGMNSEV